MSSAISSINEVLAAYVAGRVKADRVVATVAAAYYREAGKSKGQWRPIIDVIERSAPGMVELVGLPGRPGFEIRLGQREFPRAYEPELKKAVEAVLRGARGAGSGSVARTTDDGQPTTSFVSRVFAAVRRLFSASA